MRFVIALVVLELLLVNSSSIFSQSNSIVDEYWNFVDESSSIYEKNVIIDSLVQDHCKECNPTQVADSCYSLIKAVWRTDLELAISLADSVHNLGINTNSTGEDIFTRINYNRVLFKYNFGEYYKALEDAQYYLSTYKDENLRKGKMLRLLGGIYTDIGDLENSVLSFKQSERIFLALNNRKELGKTYINMTRTCATNEDEDYFHIGLEAVSKVDSSIIELFTEENRATFFMNSGTLYDLTNQNERAIESYLFGLETAIKVEDSLLISQILANISVLSKELGKFSEAESYMNEAKKYSLGSPKYEGMVSNNLADIYLAKSDYQKAIELYDYSVYQILDRTDYTTSPLSVEWITRSPHKIDILGYLIDKGNCALKMYQNNLGQPFLELAFETFELADQVLDDIYFESREDLSKLTWRKKSAELYESAIQACYHLNNLEKAFYFMEKSSALLVLENLTNVKAKELAGLPNEVRQEEAQLLSIIHDLELELSETDLEQSELDSLEQEYFQEKSNYLNFISSLEESYPEYFRYRKRINIASLEEVQSQLSPNEISISYHIGENSNHVFLMTSDDAELKKVDLSEIMLEEYYESLLNPLKTKEEILNYDQRSNALFRALFPFENARDMFQNKTLTIVPGVSLQMLPFESLIVNPDKVNWDFLIGYSDIHYQLSYSLNQELNSLKTAYDKGIVCFSPIDFPNSELVSLDQSKSETDQISSEFNGVSFQYAQASKAEFFKEYGRSKVVHLSTHGGLDGHTPWLVFYDQKMMINELYFEGLQSELVVLSACRTSAGKLQKGEGVMSMSREFINSGAKSVISSLWEMNESAGLEITSGFYRYLNEGLTKSEALRKSKLDYLQENAGTSQASPYFWSSIILTGSNDSLILGNGHSTFIWITLFLGLSLMLFYLYKRKSKKISY